MKLFFAFAFTLVFLIMFSYALVDAASQENKNH